MTHENAINEQIEAHKLRLQGLKIQEAVYGFSVDPHIPIEINSIQEKIRALQIELSRISQEEGIVISEASQVRVLVADDTVAMRNGIEGFLERVDWLELMVDEPETIQQTIRVVKHEKPDVLIIDLRWHNNDEAGIKAIEEIRKMAKRPQVIAVTAYDNLLGAAMKAGAQFGLTTREIDEETLLNLIWDASGRTGTRPSTTLDIDDLLSGREVKILRLVASGYIDKDIADKLAVSIPTVKRDMDNIFNKLAAKNRPHAVFIASKVGLI